MGYVVKKAAQRFEEKKAAIYVRVSTQYQVDRASLPVQREELINYAKYALGISDYVISRMQATLPKIPTVQTISR